MNITIERGAKSDIDELAQLYDDLNDYLAGGTNYPGWRKGLYPTRENAVKGVGHQTLYVAKESGKIAGSIILNHDPEPAYHQAAWGINANYSDIFVVHTFVVHPAYLKAGIGTCLMEFVIRHSMDKHMKAIRLDVYENNLPAIKLYEKSGFHYVDTVDLGLGCYGLDRFRLYEKLLQPQDA